MVNRLSQMSLQPACEAVSGESFAAENYWAQWDALRLDDGVLQRLWTSHDCLLHYCSLVLFMKLRKAMLEEVQSNVTWGNLGIKMTEPLALQVG